MAAKDKRKPRTVFSPEVRKIYNALALDTKLKRDPERELMPIAWTRIYKLPDFAFFDHRSHITAGVACQTCHGAVETMELMRQVPDLSMGWCVRCHRDATRNNVNGRKVFASINCSICHH